jgi:peroxiredoxin
MFRLPHLAPRRALLAMLAALALGACGTREAAPNFSYTLLDGSRAHTEQLRGKVLLVNFWATSCTSCVHEMPSIVATQAKYQGRGFETLAVAMSYDAPASVSLFAEHRGLPFGVVIDNTGAIAKAFGDVAATPTTFLIDKHGAIARRFVGEPDFAELHALVEKLLAET